MESTDKKTSWLITVKPFCLLLLLATLLSASLTINLAAQDSLEGNAATAPVVFQRETTPSPGLNNLLLGISGDAENDIWTVGTFARGALALHFNGSNWSSVPMALPAADMQGVSVLSADDVWAVGSVFNFNTQHNASVIQHFDGKKWSAVASPQFASGDQLFAVKAIANDDVFAVGELHSDSQKPLPLIEHFDGTKWVVVPVPKLNSGQTLTLGAIAAVSHSDVWVVGSGEPQQPAIMHFDGQKFVNVPFPSVPFATLTGLAAIAADDVWVVGSQLANGNDDTTLAAHWDGKRFTIVPTPNLTRTNELRAVSAISSSDIWAAGCTACGADIGVNQVILVEHWDGKRWSINPTPLIGKGDFDFPGSVLTFPSGSVYVAGTSANSNLHSSQTLVLHATEGNLTGRRNLNDQSMSIGNVNARQLDNAKYGIGSRQSGGEANRAGGATPHHEDGERGGEVRVE